MVFSIAERTRRFSSTIQIILGTVFGSIIGIWGYHAGGVGGALAFTIGGLFTGAMMGAELPDAIMAFFGTGKRIVLFFAFLSVTVFLHLFFNALLLGLLLFVFAYGYFIYSK